MSIIRNPIIAEHSPGAASSDGRLGPPASGSSAPAYDRAEDAQLRRRRDALAEQVTELHWDLGGLAYEMAIRDHFRLDVLIRRAALLQERDAELAEVERLLRMQDGGIAGHCPHCGSPHSRGAIYCWQCGAALMERTASSVVAPSAGTTASVDDTVAMEALLPPGEGSGHAGS